MQAGGFTRSVTKETAVTEREFFLHRREAESGAFDRVLEPLPRERFDYRPHERSPSAREIVWTLAIARDPWLDSFRGDVGFVAVLREAETRRRGAPLTFARAGGDLVLGLTP
jgi:hypothetical protein